MTEHAETVLRAPTRLTAECRGPFRTELLDVVARATTARHVVVVDLTETREIDSSGLGLLVLVEKRARENGLATVLRKPHHAVRSMLAATKLDLLFNIQD